MGQPQKRSFKSKEKISGGQGTYRKWKEWEEGDYVIGKWTSVRKDQYKKNAYTLDVYECNFDKKLVDKSMTLNSCGMLDKAMEKLDMGDLIKVTYNGTSTIESGPNEGTESHLIEVDLCEEEGDEEQPAKTAKKKAKRDEEEDEEEETYFGDENDDEDEIPF